MISPKPFSKKQLQLLSWWAKTSPVKEADGIIADGSIRAGKTFPMALSFVEWAFAEFSGQNFIIAGKTVGSLRRNVLSWLLPTLRESGYQVEHKRTENLVKVYGGGKLNSFYIFGGKDESSQDLVQGMTAAGALFDEVALMPESFVNQATGRCSAEGAKLWFNCNPDSPSHWFKRNWLDKARSKRLLHVHFMMDDNPSLSPGTIRRYQSLYSGVFYKRFIQGLWVVAEGAIYDMWDPAVNVYGDLPVPLGDVESATRYISIDYGTQNAMVFLDILDTGKKILVHREYHYSGRESGAQKTDHQYGDEFEAFVGPPETVHRVIIDPSAASFIAELKNRGYRVKQADNEVLDGIRMTASLIAQGVLLVSESCENLIREIGSYVWDSKLTDKGKEQPVKANDHGPDALRYFVKTIITPRRMAQWIDW